MRSLARVTGVISPLKQLCFPVLGVGRYTTRDLSTVETQPTFAVDRGGLTQRSVGINEMSNLSSLANVSIAKDKYIARLQQRMPMAIQALAATIATRATSSSSDASSTRRDEEWSVVNSCPMGMPVGSGWGVRGESGAEQWSTGHLHSLTSPSPWPVRCRPFPCVNSCVNACGPAPPPLAATLL